MGQSISFPLSVNTLSPPPELLPTHLGSNNYAFLVAVTNVNISQHFKQNCVVKFAFCYPYTVNYCVWV